MLWALHHFPASSLAISQAHLHLYFPLLIFVMLWFSAKSLYIWFPLPGILFSVLAVPVGYLLKIYSFHFSYRILEILGLRESGPKTWSRGGHSIPFQLIICTRRSQWNTWKDFPYLIIGRYASKNSQPQSPLPFFPRKLIVRPGPAVDQWEKRKRYWLESRLPGTSAPMLGTLTTRHFLM